jgi:hypothetical protein
LGTALGAGWVDRVFALSGWDWALAAGNHESANKTKAGTMVTLTIRIAWQRLMDDAVCVQMSAV